MNEENNEEEEEDLDYLECWEEVEPLLIEYIKSGQDSLMNKIEKILFSADYYDSKTIYAAEDIAKKIHGKTVTTSQWSSLTTLLRNIIESGDYDDDYCSILRDSVSFNDVEIGYITIVGGGLRSEASSTTVLCRIIKE